MLSNKLSKLRFSLKSVLILILGIAIGYSLNLETLRFLTRRAPYSTAIPPYVIAPPDVLRVEVYDKSRNVFPVGFGHHCVGPDGRVNLGGLGSVYVAGMTIDEARTAIEKAAATSIESPQVIVDVDAVKSKLYYVIQESNNGDTVVSVPITGNETVLDAIAQIGGLNAAGLTLVYIVRQPLSGLVSPATIPVEWSKIARGESETTNYQLLPGDRLFISTRPTTSPTN